MSDPHAYENIKRCPTCGISWMPSDIALWCKQPGCPKTEQRWPTEEQVRKYKIGEPYVVQR